VCPYACTLGAQGFFARVDGETMQQLAAVKVSYPAKLPFIIYKEAQVGGWVAQSPIVFPAAVLRRGLCAPTPGVPRVAQSAVPRAAAPCG
jgi:hypothetical protein